MSDTTSVQILACLGNLFYLLHFENTLRFEYDMNEVMLIYIILLFCYITLLFGAIVAPCHDCQIC